MRFANPEVLWLLALILPALAAFLVWAWRRKQKLVSQFVQSRLLANLTVGVSYNRQKLRLVLLFCAVAFALLALARPQWGFDWQEAHQQGLDIIVAIDTSKSMLAPDVSPDRLTRAKYAAFDLMKLAKSDRLGLIAFAGTAFLQCPLTLDEEAFRQSVQALNVNIIPSGGTALSEAIDTAIEAFEKSDNQRVLVLFTDGEDQDSNSAAAAEKAATENLKIFTIGVGTREGEMLRVRDERGNLVFLKDDQGNAVKSRLNETLLQQIATKGGGFYLPLVGANPMESLYREGLSRLAKTESTSKLVKNYREQFKWPLGLAILTLIIEIFLPHRKRVRKSEEMIAATNAGLKKAVGAITLLAVPLICFGSLGTAAKKYEAGAFEEAFTEYQKIIAKKTNDFRLYYNAGDAAYKAQQFDAAKQHFDVALQSPDLKLQQQAYYNLGNTLYELGATEQDPKAKQEGWESAIHNYESALKLNPQDNDAKHNVAFVKKKLEELKQQQQSKDDKNQQKDDKNKDEKENEKKNDQQQNDEQKQGSPAKDPKNEEQQKKDHQQQQEQQKQAEQDKQKQQQQAQQSGDKNDEEEEAQPVAGAQMTLQQALQFLEAQKQQDRTLIFAPPPDQKPKDPNIKLKDW